MYGNTISREADLPCKPWRSLPPEPAEQSELSTEDYDNCSAESSYDSISLPCERKTPAKPLDPDIKAVTGPSIFSPVQWKKYWKRNRICVLLILNGICLLLSVILLLSNTSILSELRSQNWSSTKDGCDSSLAPFNFTELETSVITKLKSLEQQFDEKKNISLQKIEEQLLRIGRKLGRLQNCRAWLKRGTSIMLKYACVVKEDCRLVAADSKGRNEYTSWRRFQTNVYYFSDKEENWEMARKTCADRDSHLVIINTKQEQDFVIQTSKNSIWLGLSDIEKEGTWHWVDGSPLKERFRSWREGEPNNAGKNGEDCAVLYKEGKWNDIHCDIQVQFVCEKEGVSV